jgi:hypothetical protein
MRVHPESAIRGENKLGDETNESPDTGAGSDTG